MAKRHLAIIICISDCAAERRYFVFLFACNIRISLFPAIWFREQTKSTQKSTSRNDIGCLSRSVASSFWPARLFCLTLLSVDHRCRRCCLPSHPVLSV